MEKSIALVFFVSVALYFMIPIMDVDFPWHLKTGEYIFQHKEIPASDPFSVASTGGRIERFALSQYWLAQVIFYLIFSTIGPFGIILLRVLIFAGIIAILWVCMGTKSPWLKAAILYLTATLFLVYMGDRPQLFTFILTPVVVLLLEHFRKTSSPKSLFFLPIVMLFWANVHGGFILGSVLIMIVCVAETVKYFLIKKPSVPLTQEKLLWLLVMGFISIMIAYINPNGYYPLTLTMEIAGSPYAKAIKEYNTPLTETLGPFASRANFIYWFLMGYVLVILALNLRRADITHLGLVLFTLAISLTAVRYVPFFVMVGLVIAGGYSIDSPRTGRFDGLKKLKTPMNILLLLVLLFWCGFRFHKLPNNLQLTGMVSSKIFPEEAMRFLETEIGSAKIFNSHTTGSYLIYRLYPQFKSFIDTRSYNREVAFEANDITYAKRWDGDQYSLWDALADVLPKKYGNIDIQMGDKPAHPPKQEKWKRLLEEKHIEVIMHEATNVFTGELYPIAMRLLLAKEWRLVYMDGKVMIFVKDIPRFRNVIKKYEISKEKIFDEIGMENAPRLGRTIQPRVYSSLALALLMKGAPDSSIKELIRHALFLDPKDIMASYLEAFLALKSAKK